MGRLSASIGPWTRESIRRGRGRFPDFQLGLAATGGFDGIHSCLQVRLFEEVAPALLVVGRALSFRKIPQGSLGVGATLDDFDDAGRLVGPNIMANDYIGSVGFVACQKGSMCRFASAGHECFALLRAEESCVTAPG
jgi:hypothetical protein